MALVENIDKEIFIKTDNSNRIINFCNTIIARNQWASIIGEPGSGKTEIKRHLLTYLKGFPDRYIVSEIPVFHSAQPRTGAIMKELIRAIDPDVHIPGNIETKYRVLRNALVKAHTSNKKVVIVFEESQNLSHNMMRELKMLHEIEGMGKSNLFAMIMFLKTDVRFEEIFKTREIGKRVILEKMNLLTDKEIIQIATDRFGLQFLDGSSKSEFIQSTGGYPATIKHIAQTLWALPGFSGKVSKIILASSRITQFKTELKENGITNREIRIYLKQTKGMDASLGVINESINGKRKGKTADAILEVTQELINIKRAHAV
jgi:type II secretory pathway predicted ATPase ExeA